MEIVKYIEPTSTAENAKKYQELYDTARAIFFLYPEFDSTYYLRHTFHCDNGDIIYIISRYDSGYHAYVSKGGLIDYKTGWVVDPRFTKIEWDKVFTSSGLNIDGHLLIYNKQLRETVYCAPTDLPIERKLELDILNKTNVVVVDVGERFAIYCREKVFIWVGDKWTLTGAKLFYASCDAIHVVAQNQLQFMHNGDIFFTHHDKPYCIHDAENCANIMQLNTDNVPIGTPVYCGPITRVSPDCQFGAVDAAFIANAADLVQIEGSILYKCGDDICYISGKYIINTITGDRIECITREWAFSKYTVDVDISTLVPIDCEIPEDYKTLYCFKNGDEYNVVMYNKDIHTLCKMAPKVDTGRLTKTAARDD